MKLVLAFENDVPGVRNRHVEAIKLFENPSFNKLEGISRQLGARPLSAYWRDPAGRFPSTLAAFMSSIGHWDEERWGPRPAPCWYDAWQGLDTLLTLLAYLDNHPRAIRSGIRELRAMARALQSAKDAGVRFHLHKSMDP